MIFFKLPRKKKTRKKTSYPAEMPYLTTGHWDNVESLLAICSLCLSAQINMMVGQRPLSTDNSNSGPEKVSAAVAGGGSWDSLEQ